MADAIYLTVWMGLLAGMFGHMHAAPFPFGYENEGALQQWYGDEYEPVGLTQRDAERLSYEQWPQNQELLSRHKYKFDNYQIPDINPSLLEDPEFMKLVSEELYKLVYQEVFEEKLAELISELTRPEDEPGVMNQAAPFKRGDSDFWKYYVTTENDLPGLRRRSGFDLQDQYLLSEGIPLKREFRRSWGDFKDSKPRRAFAKGSGISDKSVVNKKASNEDNLQDFDWDDLQQLVKRFGSGGYEQQYQQTPDGYQQESSWGQFPDEEPSFYNRRAEPIADLVGPYTGYNMFGRLLAEGKRTQDYDDRLPFITQLRRSGPLWNEPAYDDLPFLKLDDAEDYSYTESVQEEDSTNSEEGSFIENDDQGHFWDNFVEKLEEMPVVPIQENSEVEEEELMNDADNDLDGMLVFPKEGENIEVIEEFDPEGDEVVKEEIIDEEPVSVDKEEIKANLRKQILELLKKFEELRRR